MKRENSTDGNEIKEVRTAVNCTLVGQ